MTEAVGGALRGAEALHRALRLVFVTPGDRDVATTLALVVAACAGGVTAVLLREPQLDARARQCLAASVAEALGSTAVLTVSRDIAAAQAGRALAVHCGHGGPTVASVRAAGYAAGRSAHWPLCAEDEAADYLTLSPFRPTGRSHPRALLTAEQVTTVLAAAGRARPGGVPVVALGGLGLDDVAALPDGLSGIAVMRALAEADDVTAAARSLRRAVEARWPLDASPGGD